MIIVKTVSVMLEVSVVKGDTKMGSLETDKDANHSMNRNIDSDPIPIQSWCHSILQSAYQSRLTNKGTVIDTLSIT